MIKPGRPCRCGVTVYTQIVDGWSREIELMEPEKSSIAYRANTHSEWRELDDAMLAYLHVCPVVKETPEEIDEDEFWVTARDKVIGTHPCPRCKAEANALCYDLRYTASTSHPTTWPHKERVKKWIDTLPENSPFVAFYEELDDA